MPFGLDFSHQSRVYPFPGLLISVSLSAAIVAMNNSTFYANLSFYCSWTMLLICLSGILLNILSIIVFSNARMRYQPINILLLGLSVSDMLLLMFAIPVFCITGINARYSNIFLVNFASYSTIIAYPMACMCQTMSIWLLVVITMERYFAVCHPLQISVRDRPIKRAVIVTLSVTVAAILYNGCRFVEFKLGQQEATIKGELINITTATDWYRRHPIYEKVYYVGLYIILHFIAPFLVISIMNMYIVFHIGKARQVRKTLSSHQEKEHRTAIMIAIVIATFVTTNTAPFILNIVEMINPTLFEAEKTKDKAYAALDISNAGVVANSASTIFVYLLFSQKYRETFVHIFLGRFCPSLSTNFGDRRGTVRGTIRGGLTPTGERESSFATSTRRGTVPNRQTYSKLEPDSRSSVKKYSCVTSLSNDQTIENCV